MMQMTRLSPIIMSALLAFCGSVFSRVSPVTVDFIDSAAVNDTVIRLKDIAVILFPGIENQPIALQNTVVGEAAPAGYTRLVSTDEVFDYVLKTRCPNFSFVRTPKKVLRVATIFQEKKVSEYEGFIKKFLGDSIKWPSGDFSISIKNGEEKWKCLKMPFEVGMAGLVAGYPRGNINLKIIARQGTKTYSIPVVCYVTVVTSVVVANNTINRGAQLSAENCQIERKDITRFGYEPITNLSSLKDYLTIRTVPKETIIHEKMVMRAPVIAKDELVYLVVESGVVKVSALMRAREAGAVGDRIWVENEMSHKLIKAIVVGKGKTMLLEGEKMI
jgi:flagella basal body P-ring formation protein FlgA